MPPPPPPPPLLYPSLGLIDIDTQAVTLTDPERTGQVDRPIPVMIRYSPSAPLPMPVVVLSHGGASGHVTATGAMAEWAAMLAEHGYLTVAIAHTPRTDIERIVLSMNLGGTLPQCREFKYLGYDRPLDFRRVVEGLIERSASPPWAGRIDMSALAYMGHSSGAGSAMMIAGAGREYMPGLGLSFASRPEPLAFVAMSPQGAGEDGFSADSWDAVDRPVLMCTGASDGDVPHERRDPFEYMDGPDKYQLWIEDPGATHTLFEGTTDSCVRATGDAARCDEMHEWLASAIRAFVDAYVRLDPAAVAYLATDSLVQASAGTIEWDSK